MDRKLPCANLWGIALLITYLLSITFPFVQFIDLNDQSHQDRRAIEPDYSLRSVFIKFVHDMVGAHP